MPLFIKTIVCPVLAGITHWCSTRDRIEHRMVRSVKCTVHPCA